MTKFNAREIAGSVVARIMGQDEDLPMAPEIEKAIKEAYLAGRREQAEMDANLPDARSNVLSAAWLSNAILEAAKKIGSEEEK
jgi:hypothetical protein